MKASRRDWDFASMTTAQFATLFDVANGIAAIVGGQLVLTAGTGAASIDVTLRSDQPLGIDLATSHFAKVEVASSSVAMKAEPSRRFQGTAAAAFSAEPSQAKPLVGGATANVQLRQLAGASRVLNQFRLAFKPTSGSFTGGETVVLQSLRVRDNEASTNPGLHLDDLKGQHVAAIDGTTKAITIRRKDGVSGRAEFLLAAATSDLFNLDSTGAATFKDFNVDYAVRPWAQMTITGNTGGGFFTVAPSTTADLALLRDSNWQNLILETEGPTNADDGLAATVSVRESDPTRQKTQPVESFFARWNRPTFDGSGPYTVKFAQAGDIAVGDSFTLTSRNAGYSVFELNDTGAITVENVNVYRNAGTTISSQSANGQVVIDNLQLATRTSADWITQPADGIHMNSLDWKLPTPTSTAKSVSLTNSTLSGMLDDAFALYQSANQIAATTTVAGKTQVTVLAPFPPKVGDAVVIYGKEGVRRTGDAVGDPYKLTVASVTLVSGSEYTIVLDQLVSGIVVTGDRETTDNLYNLSRNCPNFYVADTTFRDNRGAGVMTRVGNGTITNCDFIRNGGAGVSLGNEYGTNTGFFPSDVAITSCDFVDVNRIRGAYARGKVGQYYGAIQAATVDVSDPPAGEQIAHYAVERLIRNLTIDGCTFTGIHRAGVNLTSVQTATITNSTFTGHATDNVPVDGVTAAIILTNSGDVEIRDVTITDGRATADAGVLVDPYLSVTPGLRSAPPRIGANVTATLPAGVKLVSDSLHEQPFAGTSLPTGWTPASGTWGVSAGRLNWSNNAAEGVIRYGATWSDYTAAATVRMTAIPGGGTGSGFAFRMADADNYYMVTAHPTLNSFRLLKRTKVGSTVTWTTLAHTPMTVSLNVDYRLWVSVEGSQIRARVLGATGVAELSTTDATIATGGVGFRSFGTAATFDDVVVLPLYAGTAMRSAAPLFTLLPTRTRTRTEHGPSLAEQLFAG